MKKVLSLLAALTLIVSIAVSPAFAGGGKVQGDNSAQGDEQGDLGKGDSPGEDAMGRQV